MTDAQRLAALGEAVQALHPRIAELDRKLLARTPRRQLQAHFARTLPGIERTMLELELMKRRSSPRYLVVGAVAIYTMLGLIALAFYLIAKR